jgi:hypothetical protein
MPATAGTATAITARAPAARAGISLANAPIPATCEHPATTLDGSTKDFGQDGFARLETAYARQGHLKGHRGAVAVVPLTCSAGGVTWPQHLLVYQKGPAGPTLVGSVHLSSKTARQEHEDVTAMRFRHRKLRVSWHGYDGAGFTVAPYRGTLGWSKKHLTWKHSGPLVIDYASDQTGTPNGAEVTGPHQARALLAPAPKSFTRFIRHRFNKLVASAGECAQYADVSVQRYSHQGFAVGGEGACGGALYLWAHVGGRWKAILGWQDYPRCGSLTRLQRRGYVATGQACWSGKAQNPVTLGDWPRSGI